MGMLILLATAASAQQPATAPPMREAQIANAGELASNNLSVNDLPLDFPEGTATVRLDVNAKGKLTGCKVTDWEVGGTIDPAVETMICTGLRQRAKLIPALDAAGAPVASVLMTGIDPHLPNEPTFANSKPIFVPDNYPVAALRAGAQGGVTVRLSVDAKNKLYDCNVLGSSGHPLLDGETCRLFKANAKVVSGRDANGLPVAGSMIYTVRWQLPDKRLLRDYYARTNVTFDAKGDVVGCRSFYGDKYLKDEACRLLRNVGLRNLTPIQRAFRTLSKVEGLVVGPPDMAKTLGTGPGETRLLLHAANVSFADNGKVTSCEPADPTDRLSVKDLCGPLRQITFLFDEAPGDRKARSAVVYSALILKRPGM